MAQAISVPRRADLLDQMHRANRFAWILLLVEIAMIGIVAVVVDWRWVLREPILTTVAIGAMVCPFASSVLIHLATKKKRIQDLKESTRFGQYDKYRLQALFRETLASLRLPEEDLPVYIVASRSLNASAMHVGVGSLFKSLNGIYLNRQVLHKMEPAEIQDLIGHELGHYYKYYLVIDRFRVVTVALGSLLGILVVQRVGLGSFFGYAILMGVPWLSWWLSSLPYTRNATAIEFLCDDFGAQVGGVFPSIHGLLKLGQSAEVECVVMQQAILSKVAGNFNPSELIDAITSSIPYGHATREEITDKVNRELNHRAATNSKSIGGLLRYMWNSDVDADSASELEEEAKKIAKIQSEPRLDWEQLLSNPTQIQFNEDGMRKLIAMIENRPNELLFRVPESSGEVHPPLRTRILYLWHNRSEIENQVRSRV